MNQGGDGGGDTSAGGAGVLLHICGTADWEAARDAGELRPRSLAEHGFVHLSTPEQVLLPAHRVYAGRVDLVLLVVDPGELGPSVRWEEGVPPEPGQLFPHLYAPLPVGAVVAVVPFPWDPEVGFRLPGDVPGGGVTGRR